jgi:AraC-like DNA-binding protein
VPSPTRQRTIAVLGYEVAQILDIIGPAEVFAVADARGSSASVCRRPTQHASLRALLDGVAEDPAGDHRLAVLSARAGFSERHLSRVFARELRRRSFPGPGGVVDARRMPTITPQDAAEIYYKDW